MASSAWTQWRSSSFLLLLTVACTVQAPAGDEFEGDGVVREDGGALQLDVERVPVVDGCEPGDVVTRTEGGWSCVRDEAVSWARLDDVPADLADGDDVGIVVADTCAVGDVPKFVGDGFGCRPDTDTRAVWSDLAGVPDDLRDGDADTLGALTCSANQQLLFDGVQWGCFDGAAATTWNTLDGIPTGFADGNDADRLSALSCAAGQVPRFDGAEWSCSDVSPAASWSSLLDVPAELLDGDADALGALDCDDAEVARWDTDSDTWRCAAALLPGAEVSADQLTTGTLAPSVYSAFDDLEAEGRIGDGASQLAPGSHEHTWSALTDPEGPGACGSHGVPRRNAADTAWECVPLDESVVDAFVADNGFASMAEALADEEALLAHEGASLEVHGIADTSALLTQSSALNADQLQSGTLSPDRYDAYADLADAARIGTGNTQLAPGDHGHAWSDLDGAGCGANAVIRRSADQLSWECAAYDESTVDAFVANNGFALSTDTDAVAAEVESARGGQTNLDTRIAQLEAQLAALLSARDGLDAWGCPDSDTDDGIREMIAIGDSCVDAYEVSLKDGAAADLATGNEVVDPDCEWADPAPACLGHINGGDTTAIAQSRPGENPLHSITWFQAAALCANAGKRLCTNEEWQVAAYGTPDPFGNGDADPCNINDSILPAGATSDDSGTDDASNRHKTGTAAGCVSARGVYDMAGNLDEWVSLWTQSGLTWQTTETGMAFALWPDSDDIARGFNGRALGPEFVWTDGMPGAGRRGGMHAGGDDAGPYAISVATGPAIGWLYYGLRCCVKTQSPSLRPIRPRRSAPEDCRRDANDTQPPALYWPQRLVACH